MSKWLILKAKIYRISSCFIIGFLLQLLQILLVQIEIKGIYLVLEKYIIYFFGYCII